MLEPRGAFGVSRGEQVRFTIGSGGRLNWSPGGDTCRGGCTRVVLTKCVGAGVSGTEPAKGGGDGTGGYCSGKRCSWAGLGGGGLGVAESRLVDGSGGDHAV